MTRNPLYFPPGIARRWLLRWRAHWVHVRTRRQLSQLSDAQLRDIGLSRSQALREARLPVWRGTRYAPPGSTY